jgi:hypothetical protein
MNDDVDYNKVLEGGNAKLLTLLFQEIFCKKEINVKYVCSNAFYDVIGCHLYNSCRTEDIKPQEAGWQSIFVMSQLDEKPRKEFDSLVYDKELWGKNYFVE